MECAAPTRPASPRRAHRGSAPPGIWRAARPSAWRSPCAPNSASSARSACACCPEACTPPAKRCSTSELAGARLPELTVAAAAAAGGGGRAGSRVGRAGGWAGERVGERVGGCRRRRARLLVCSLSMCLRYTSYQKSLQMNLMISSVSEKRGLSLVYRSTRRSPTWKPTASSFRPACCSCAVDGLGSLPSSICTSSMCRYSPHDSWQAPKGLASAATGSRGQTGARGRGRTATSLVLPGDVMWQPRRAPLELACAARALCRVRRGQLQRTRSQKLCTAIRGGPRPLLASDQCDAALPAR